MPKRVKINGQRGRWVAAIGDRRRGVLHPTLRAGTDRCQVPVLPEHVGGKRPGEREQALREHDLAGIERDKDAASLAQDGYVRVFRLKDFIIDCEHGLMLTLTECNADPKQ
jgi:hypothetical protein